MATKSFTREIRITEPSAIRKIDDAMRSNTADNYRTSFRNIDEMQTANRKSLANRITKKY